MLTCIAHATGHIHGHAQLPTAVVLGAVALAVGLVIKLIGEGGGR